jgi:hypothetical protein
VGCCGFVAFLFFALVVVALFVGGFYVIQGHHGIP